MAKKRRKRKKDTLEYMPSFLRWVADHPLLRVKDADLDTLHVDAEKVYLKGNPCPSQMAQNMLEHYRGNPAKLDRLFFNVTRYQIEHEKRQANTALDKEDAAIADLEATMKMALGDLL
jgi:hypothetical protein